MHQQQEAKPTLVLPLWFQALLQAKLPSWGVTHAAAAADNIHLGATTCGSRVCRHLRMPPVLGTYPM